MHSTPQRPFPFSQPPTVLSIYPIAGQIQGRDRAHLRRPDERNLRGLPAHAVHRACTVLTQEVDPHARVDHHHAAPLHDRLVAGGVRHRVGDHEGGVLGGGQSGGDRPHSECGDLVSQVAVHVVPRRRPGHVEGNELQHRMDHQLHAVVVDCQLPVTCLR
eukprot:9503913-Pyramimonas_sp.AAC.1